jgi:uncharacterized protein YaiI (UPF0178 family)
MLDLFVDIDGCPVYPQIIRAARRYSLDLYVVTRGYRDAGSDACLILNDDDRQAGSEWIAANISANDICVTGHLDLAARCLLRDAVALDPAGNTWTGDALANVFAKAPPSRTQASAHGFYTGPLDPERFASRLAAAISAVQAIGRVRECPGAPAGITPPLRRVGAMRRSPTEPNGRARIRVS